MLSKAPVSRQVGLYERIGDLLSTVAMPEKQVKWRWGVYGLLVGLAFVIASLIVEHSGYVFAPSLTPGVVRNLGGAGTVLIPGIIGLLAGLIRDRLVS